MKSWLAGLILCFCCSSHALAYEWFPEFESLTEEEQADFEGPAHLSAEYSMDVLTYSKPESWEYRWLTHGVGFDLSVGSLDATHFLMDDRFKFTAALEDYLEFRFVHFDERDFDKQSLHSIFELIAKPKSWIGLSLYGEPDFFKRKNDTGLAMVLRPTERHEIRIFNTFVDVTLLKRNDRPDTFVEPFLPYARGVVGRVFSEGKGEDPLQQGDYLEYAIRLEPRTQWLFPQQEYLYEYWRNYASLLFSQGLGPNLRFYLQNEWDRKFESKYPTGLSSQITGQAWTTTRWVSNGNVTIQDLGPEKKWDLSLGMTYASRVWDTTLGYATYRDLIPNVRLGLPAFGKGPYQDRWELFLMAGWHRSSGPAGLFDSNEKDGVVEHRLSLIYQFVFGEKSRIRLQASADLDSFGEPKSWDGGNAQMVLLF